MVHFLLAALQIGWAGVGAPPKGSVTLPIIIARAPEGRIPMLPSAQLTLLALNGRSPVPAEWSVSPGGAVTFNPWTPSGSQSPGTGVAMTEYRGPATVRASFGAQSVSMPAFVYNSVAPTCYMSYPNGVLFNDNGVAEPAGTPQQSDVFTLGPQNTPRMNALYGCTGAFANGGSSFTVHFPFGATVIRRSSAAYFGNVRVSDWRNQYTTVPNLQSGDIVVFRLHDGRTAKLLVDPPAPGTFGGIYLAGPPHGDFYDYVFYHKVKSAPHAIFSRHD